MGRPNEQSQDVEFTPGIRQDVDPVRAPRGALVDAVNVRLGRQGAIKGRRGTRTIPPTSSAVDHVIQNATEQVGVLGKVGTAGIIGVSGKIFARDSTRVLMDYQGRYSSARPVRKRHSLVSSGGQTSFGADRRRAIAVNSAGYILVAASEFNQIIYTVEAPDGSRVFVGARTGTTYGTCGAVAVGNVFYLLCVTLFDIQVRSITVGSGAVSVGTPTTIGTLFAPSSLAAYWDITPAADGTHWYLVFQNSSTTLRVDRFAGITSNANQTISGLTGDCPPSIYADATDVYVGWHNDPTVTGEVRYRTLATNLGSFRSAVTTIATGTTFGPPLFGPASAGSACFVFRQSNVGTPFTCSMRWGTASSPNNSGVAGTVTGPTVSWHARPISKPDSKQRVWVVFSSFATNWQSERVALVRLDIFGGVRPDPVVELVYPQTPKPLFPSGGNTYFHHVAEHANAHFFAVPRMIQSALYSGGTDLFSIDVLEYLPSSLAPHRQLVELGSSSMVTGQPVELWGCGYPTRQANSGTLVDAQSIGASEVGFVYPPAVLTATETVGGYLTALGSYKWMFMFQWVDVYGRRHLSAPSAVYEIAALGVGNQGVTFSVTSCAYTQRHAGVAPGFLVGLIAYRTVAGGSTFFLETSPNYIPSAYDVATGQVAMTSGGVGTSDADIRDGERAYTDGGVQQRDIAPSCIFSCESEDRVWLGGLWDGTIIQASLTMVPGEPVQFTDHESHQVVLPDLCTGLAYLDGAVIAFAKRAVYAITGDGPNDQGIGAFSTPRAICRDIGCVDYRSIVETAQGVIFKGERGFYLLPRGLGQPLFIGAAVQRFTSGTGSGYTTVLGAATVADSETRTARFLVSTGSAEMVLVYDLDIATGDPLMGWTRDTYSQRLAAIGAWPDGLALAKRDLSSATHALYLEESTPSFLIDASNTEAITTAIETAELRPAGLVGWWACNCVGAVLSNADGGVLTITVTTDSDSANPASNITTPDSPWSMPASPSFAYRFVQPQQPQCTSAKVSLSCLRSTAVLGPTFHGLTIEQSPLGMRRAGDNER